MVFNSLEHVTRNEMICKTYFDKKKYDIHCIGKEYAMTDKTKQTEYQAHIFQKSSIIDKRFPVSHC